MRKPKIGDIVIVHDEDGYVIPAIVASVAISHAILTNLFVIHPQKGTYFTPCNYSQTLRKGYWSWPEEEKQCEHESYIKRFGGQESTRYECMKCGEMVGEKPKECEHDSWTLKCVECNAPYGTSPGKCVHTHWSFQCEKYKNKAEELIDKVWSELIKWYKESPPNVHNDVLRLHNMYDLIKEYKGIK